MKLTIGRRTGRRPIWQNVRRSNRIGLAQIAGGASLPSTCARGPGRVAATNPEARVAAVGAKADWITSDHPLQFGYGAGSPLEKLCDVGGKILLLGPLFDSLTILHYAEHIADVPDKRTERYRWPVLRDGKREWIAFEQFDTSSGIADWPDGGYFQRIAKEYMARGRHAEGRVGAADSYLFDARSLADFAIEWLENQFG